MGRGALAKRGSGMDGRLMCGVRRAAEQLNLSFKQQRIPSSILVVPICSISFTYTATFPFTLPFSPFANLIFLQQPFNAFLAGFSATVGQFVLTASLRIQTNPENKSEFKSISQERAFADYIMGSLILHFFCVNFIN